ncbi:unnamed protein product [Pylaiella littoralis]
MNGGQVDVVVESRLHTGLWEVSQPGTVTKINTDVGGNAGRNTTVSYDVLMDSTMSMATMAAGGDRRSACPNPSRIACKPQEHEIRAARIRVKRPKTGLGMAGDPNGRETPRGITPPRMIGQGGATREQEGSEKEEDYDEEELSESKGLRGGTRN